MRIFSKILAIAFSLMLVISLTACGSDEESTNNNSGASKPTATSPSDQSGNNNNGSNNNVNNEASNKNEASQGNQNNTNTNDKNPNNNIQNNDDENYENKNDIVPNLPTPPENNIPLKSIFGNWVSEIDASDILADRGYDNISSFKIKVYTQFNEDFSYSVYLEETLYEKVQNALSEYDDAFIDDCADYLVTALVEAGEFSIENNVLMLDSIEVSYHFEGSKNKLVITTTSDERKYTRI